MTENDPVVQIRGCIPPFLFVASAEVACSPAGCAAARGSPQELGALEFRGISAPVQVFAPDEARPELRLCAERRAEVDRRDETRIA